MGSWLEYVLIETLWPVVKFLLVVTLDEISKTHFPVSTAGTGWQVTGWWTQDKQKNNENYFLLISFICTIFDNFLRRFNGRLEIYVNHGFELFSLSLFTSLVELYKCIFGANVIDFEISKTVVIIIFQNPFILVNIAMCPIPP